MNNSAAASSVRSASPRNTALQCLLGLTGLFAVALPCAAELPSWAPPPKPRVMEDRLRVEVNGVWAQSDTKVRVDSSSTLQGTLVNAEDDLGLADDDVLIQAELTLLPGEHHLIRFSALSSRRSSQKVITRQIRFEDDVYNAGELVNSEMNLDLFGLTYGYRFIVQDRAELTGTFGIQIASVEANAVVRSRLVREAEDGVAPIPFLGLEGRYDFTERWSAEGRYQYLGANHDGVDGSIADSRAALTWRMNPYLVFGLGYRRFAIKVDSRRDDDSGKVDMKIDGPLLFMRASM